MSANYPPPLDQLLRLGETELGGDRPDYRAMGIGPEHVSDLVRLATDPQLLLQCDEEGVDEAQAWACEHALRALGQLGAVEGVEPLLANYGQIADIHDFWMEEFAEVMAILGPDVLPACERYFADDSHDALNRVGVSESFVKVAQAHPESRDRVVAYLSNLLATHPENDPELNGFVVSALIDLEAIEAAPVIEAAFQADRIDASIAGDWPEVRYQLGLGPKPKRNARFAPLGFETGWEPSPGSKRPDFKKLKSKKKQQKQARAHSRKRKQR
ncbi:DUF1186 domain-containing protein [Tautonia rosea]|uniref:DUF1186 domain-containing protein n=1 Tax=Tautonia rosea TaxID=2728037 RepID=UPI0014746D42|nr:DUF1186 domain-containing protein [Tautonia rosea]